MQLSSWEIGIIAVGSSAELTATQVGLNPILPTYLSLSSAYNLTINSDGKFETSPVSSPQPYAVFPVSASAIAGPTVFQYLRLDPVNDAIFSSQAALTNLNAVAQAILTRLLLFQGEWWENLNLGLPMWQSILGAPGSPKGQAAINLLITEQIKGTPYVSSVQNPTVTYTPATRALAYSATALTAFGPVPISVSPGQSATIGGA